MVEQSRKYANEFTKSLIRQRPLAFPEELKKRIKTEKEETHDEIILGSDQGSEDEEDKDKEKISEEENQEEEFGVKGLWEDGVASESLDSEEVI